MMLDYIVVGGDTFGISSYKIVRKVGALNYANFMTVGELGDDHINAYCSLYIGGDLVLEGYINEIVQVGPYQYQTNLLEFATELDTFYAYTGSDPDDPEAMTFITAKGAFVNTIVDTLLNGAGANWNRGSSNTDTTTPSGQTMPAIRFRFVQIRSSLSWFLEKYMSLYIWFSKTGDARTLYFGNIYSSSYAPASNGRTAHATPIDLTEEYKTYNANNYGVERIIIVNGSGKFVAEAIASGATTPYDTMTFQYNGEIATDAAQALADGILVERNDPTRRLEFKIQGLHLDIQEADTIQITYLGTTTTHVVFDVTIADGYTTVGSGAFGVSIFDMFGDRLTFMGGEGGVPSESAGLTVSGIIGQRTRNEE